MEMYVSIGLKYEENSSLFEYFDPEKEVTSLNTTNEILVIIQTRVESAIEFIVS